MRINGCLAAYVVYNDNAELQSSYARCLTHNQCNTARNDVYVGTDNNWRHDDNLCGGGNDQNWIFV